MKSSIKKKTYRAIYRLLDRVSPIQTNCGLLCDAACCGAGGGGSSETSSDFDMGMYLLPGEEKVFTQEEDWLRWSIDQAEFFEFPDSWTGNVYFVRCRTAPYCPRNMRPLQCRSFPLAPHLTKDGKLHLVLFTGELPYVCPLLTGTIKLEDRFIRATYTVWKHLVRDSLIRDLVEMDSAERAKHYPNDMVIIC